MKGEVEAKATFGEERLAEWDYGDYEGLVTKEIRALRKERGLDGESAWDIWRDGCEGGEYVLQSFCCWKGLPVIADGLTNAI